MNIGRALFRGPRVYFWILVALSVFTLIWMANRFLISGDILASGWFAVAGFGVLVVVFFMVVRRAAS
jgi:hypothetical protein